MSEFYLRYSPAGREWGPFTAEDRAEIDGVTKPGVLIWREATETCYHVAEFNKAAHATATADRLAEDLDAWHAADVLRVGKRVSWVGPDTRQYELDMAETVGFYGSPPLGRPATLNGRRTPRSY